VLTTGKVSQEQVGREVLELKLARRHESVQARRRPRMSPKDPDLMVLDLITFPTTLPITVVLIRGWLPTEYKLDQLKPIKALNRMSSGSKIWWSSLGLFILAKIGLPSSLMIRAPRHI
jgi:hypothetical protein